MARSKAPSKAETEAKRLEFYAECIDRPLKYLVHDVDAHDDVALQELRDDHGFGAMGRYWFLMELLASRTGHVYDVSRPNGWKRLANDLEYGRTDEGVAECRSFVEVLVELELLSSRAYGECQVRSDRVDRTASSAAKEYADRRVGAWVKAAKQQVKA